MTDGQNSYVNIAHQYYYADVW